ncbi:hypothetical protein GCM10007940_27920 [Portibacter lacus]|uniref:7TM diverse intracellular signalling n=1 Tax=Portibacter lacus TaxID=1099794 RepID=A0AA37WF24_9BACT|nr:hypothetical protein GCM10007940_27920 [Portibacter lacus]
MFLAFAANSQQIIIQHFDPNNEYFNTIPATEGIQYEANDTANLTFSIRELDSSQAFQTLFLSDAEVQILTIGNQNFYTGKYQNIRKLTQKWDNRHFTIPTNLLLNNPISLKAYNLTKIGFGIYPALLSTQKIESSFTEIISKSKKGLLFTVFFLGAICIFLLYTIGLTIQTGNPDFKFYAFYLAAILIHNTVQADAFLKVFVIFPKNPIYYHYVNEFLQMFIYAFFTLFIKVFLELKTTKPKMIPFVNGTAIAAVVFSLIFLFTMRLSRDFLFVQNYLSILWLLIAALGSAIVIGIFRNSNNPIRYYILVGSIVLLLGSFIELYTSLNLIGGYNWNIYAIPENGWYPFNYTQVAILIETVCFALGIGYKIRKQEKQYLELKQKEIMDLKIKEKNVALENQLLVKELDALRSQMNPHFLFNSLSSINNYIMKENPQEASRYLTRFSQLMRNILNNSKEQFVSLSQEIEALQLYIELENLRFKSKFKFDLNIDKEVRISHLLIPSMLIQPYVENAIKHGLFPKKTSGNLSIKIFEKNEQLHIEIADDGIGRVHSLQSKSKQDLDRKSHGMEISSNRIDLLNKIYDLNASLAIEDLTPGTKVTLTLKRITNEAEAYGSHH